MKKINFVLHFFITLAVLGLVSLSASLAYAADRELTFDEKMIAHYIYKPFVFEYSLCKTPDDFIRKMSKYLKPNSLKYLKEYLGNGPLPKLTYEFPGKLIFEIEGEKVPLYLIDFKSNQYQVGNAKWVYSKKASFQDQVELLSRMVKVKGKSGGKSASSTLDIFLPKAQAQWQGAALRAAWALGVAIGERSAPYVARATVALAKRLPARKSVMDMAIKGTKATARGTGQVAAGAAKVIATGASGGVVTATTLTVYQNGVPWKQALSCVIDGAGVKDCKPPAEEKVAVASDNSILTVVPNVEYCQGTKSTNFESSISVSDSKTKKKVTRLLVSKPDGTPIEMLEFVGERIVLTGGEYFYVANNSKTLRYIFDDKGNLKEVVQLGFKKDATPILFENQTGTPIRGLKPSIVVDPRLAEVPLQLEIAIASRDQMIDRIRDPSQDTILMTIGEGSVAAQAEAVGMKPDEIAIMLDHRMTKLKEYQDAVSKTIAMNVGSCDKDAREALSSSAAPTTEESRIQQGAVDGMAAPGN